MCKIPPAIPATITTTPATAASRFSRAGANAAAAASGAGAMASSSDHQVTASGPAPSSAEMVIRCAAPARSIAPRRHGQLGGAGTAPGTAHAAARGAGEVPAGGLCVVITRSREESPAVAALPRRPDFPAHLTTNVGPAEQELMILMNS